MLSTDNIVDYLKKNIMFKDTSYDKLKEIADIIEVTSFTDDQIIFETGDDGDAIYIIAEGQVRVHRDNQEITVLKAGECVGEMAVLDAGKRSASVSSIGDSILLKIGKEDFHKLMQRDINLMQKTLSILLGKLREQTDRDVKAKIEKALIDRDLERAREMQMAILPKEDLTIKSSDGISLTASGYCNPAIKVGGDYFDYFELPDNKFGAMIGDVKGHGFDAGLIVSMAKSCLHMQLRNNYSLQSVMNAINEVIYTYGFIPNFMYMTFCYMIFDLKTCTVSFSIAGHPFPRHYLANESRIAGIDINFGNTFLGWNEKEIFDVSSPEPFSKGDIFILFTDGITDAQNGDEKTFGEERLEELLIKNAHLSAGEIKENILRCHKDFCGDVQQADDITLVVIKIDEA